MSPTGALIKAALNTNFGWSVIRHPLFVQKRDRWLVPIVALAAAGVVPTLVLYVRLVGAGFDMLESLGQERALLTLAVLAGQLIILVFGLFYLISTFYFSRDLEFLVALPLKPSQIMLSKFAVVLINEYLTIAPLLLPVLIVYGIKNHAGPDYWLVMPLAYLLLPVIPLTAAGMVVVGMMRLVNIGRKKDLLIVIGSLVLVAAALVLQFGLTRAAGTPGEEAQRVIALIAAPEGLVQSIGRRFPPAIWATRFLHDGLFTASGFTGLALFAGLSVLLFGGLMAGAQRLFFGGLIGLSERSGGPSLGAKAAPKIRFSSGRRPVRAIFLRELRLMNRTPIFLLNGVLGVIIVPVLFALTPSSGKPGDETSDIMRLITSAKPVTAALATTLFMVVCATLSGVASSSFSREGRQFWVSKIIPVDYRQQVWAKFLHSLSIAALGIVSATAVLVFRFHLDAGMWLPGLVMALTVTAFLTCVNLAIDLARPLLDWISPQKAMKQNLNVLIAMLLDLGFLFFYGLAFLTIGKSGLRLTGVLDYGPWPGTGRRRVVLMMRFACGVILGRNLMTDRPGGPFPFATACLESAGGRLPMALESGAQGPFLGPVFRVKYDRIGGSYYVQK
jgi:ABC-2 type transport system permease protein